MAVEESEPVVKDTRPYFIENVGGIALVRLYADGFSELSFEEKLLAWHLYHAVVAGRDIAWDQNHKHGLALRRIVDTVITHPLGLRPEVEEKFIHYAKMLWLNNGPYFERNKNKFVAPFNREELLEAVGIAIANGAELNFADPIEQVLVDLDKVMFDPFFEPLVTNKNPGPQGDILKDSAGNYYDGVTMADLEGFKESYPLNSRIVKECPRKGPCTIVEQVYRAGVKDEKGKYLVAPGLYADNLEKMIGHLDMATSYSTPTQTAAIKQLIEYFRTGDPAAFDQASIAWLQDDPPVDFILGFIESYKDPRGIKAEYEGLLYFKDMELSKIMEGIARNAAYFEGKAPWAEQYKKTDMRIPVATAVNALVGTGGAGPNMPAGVNLPNAQWIREQHGSRSILLTNVMTAARMAVGDKALDEFALPEEIPFVRKYSEKVGRTMVALHEVVGHGSGKASPALKEDPAFYLKETYSTLEEARAELVALHHIFDPRLVEMGALPDGRAARVAYMDYLRAGLLQLRRVKKGNRFEDDHMRATHMIVQTMLMKEQAVEVRKVDSRTFYVIRNLDLCREAVAELLAEVMRIKAEGDIEAARRLVESRAVQFDAELRDEVVKRAEKVGVPDFVAFQAPTPRLIMDEYGVPTDVILDYSANFIDGMLDWDAVVGK